MTWTRSGRFLRASTTSTASSILRSEEHTSELQSRSDLVCRLLLEKKKKNNNDTPTRRQNNKLHAQAVTSGEAEATQNLYSLHSQMPHIYLVITNINSKQSYNIRTC